MPKPPHDKRDDQPGVLQRMRTEHQEVLESIALFLVNAEAVGNSPGENVLAERAVREAARHLEDQFSTHMRAEDDVIYPAVERALPSAAQSLAPLRDEHRELRSMLRAMLSTLDRPPSIARNEQVCVQAGDISDLLRIHIRKEEALVFAVAERLLRPDELASLAARLVRDPTLPPRPGHPERDTKGRNP